MKRDFGTIMTLVEYEAWCNRQILTFLDTLPKDTLHTDFGFGLRTPHRTVFHIAQVMLGWVRAVGPTIERPAWSTYDAAAGLDNIRAMMEQAGHALRDAATASVQAGVMDEGRRLHQLLHLITHGTHHRGQLLSMITLMGHPQPIEGGDFGGWSNLEG